MTKGKNQYAKIVWAQEERKVSDWQSKSKLKD